MMMKSKRNLINSCAVAATLALLGLAASPARASQALVTVKQLSPEIAYKAARAALENCRAKGYSVGVAVVDRAGVAQVFLRDRFAGAHTVRTAINKGWTSASFRQSTLALAAETQAGKPMSGIRELPRVIAAGGGLPIEASGAVVGAIGVSGAPGGEADQACAQAGIDAILADIEL
jgi:uncharacterized protein GlcG (DUF336 family)